MKYTAKITVMLLAAAMVLVLPGCSGDSGEMKVKTEVVRTGQIEAAFTITGAVVPAQTAEITAPFMGKVAEVNVEEGDSVSQGQILARMDDSQLNTQMMQAAAAYQGIQNTQTQAKINLDNASRTLERTKSLYAEGAVAKTQLEADQKAYDLAKNQYESSISSQANAAKASVDTIRVQIENASIKSPIAGVVLNKNITAGENAAVGSTMLTIADMSVLKLKGTVPQNALPYIKKGDLVELTIDIYPDRSFQGRIETIGSMSVSTGTYFPVEIRLENTENFASGLSAHAEIKAKGVSHMVVPSSSVVENNGESYLFVIEDGIAKKKTVITGLKNDSEIEILKGLNGNESVAITNANHLFDSMPVQIANE